MPKTPQQMATNWRSAMQNPQTSQKYKDGINNFQGNPMALAATPDAEARYLNGVQQSVASGKRTQKLQSVPVDRWKTNSVNVGSMQLSTGATKAMDKVSAHFQKWGPVYQQASAAAHALPKGGKANAMARVSAVLDVLYQAAGKTG